MPEVLINSTASTPIRTPGKMNSFIRFILFSQSYLFYEMTAAAIFLSMPDNNRISHYEKLSRILFQFSCFCIASHDLQKGSIALSQVQCIGMRCPPYLLIAREGALQ